jgi:hypothetical protein
MNQLSQYFPIDWIKLSEPPKEKTETESAGEIKPIDEEMKDAEDHKTVPENKEQTTPEETKGDKQEEADKEKQEEIPPPADTTSDFELPHISKRKSPRKITNISLDGEEYRKNFGTISTYSVPNLCFFCLSGLLFS